MASGLGWKLALTATRYGRVCRHVSLLGSTLRGPLPGLARLDTWIERLTFIVWRNGCQIADLFHFSLLFDCLLDCSLLAHLRGAVGLVRLLCQILRWIFGELAVDELRLVLLVHSTYLVLARLLLSLVLMLNKFIGTVLFEAVARGWVDGRVLVVGSDVDAAVDLGRGTFLQVLVGHGSLFFDC